MLLPIIGGGVGIVLGIAGTVGYLNYKKKSSFNIAEEIIEKAKKDADEVRKQGKLDAKENYLSLKQKAEEEYQKQKDEYSQQKKELTNTSRKIQSREDKLEHRMTVHEQKEQKVEQKLESLKQEEQGLQRKQQSLDDRASELAEKMEKIAGLTREEAKAMLVAEMEKDAKAEATVLLRQIEQDTKEVATKKSRQILTLAMQKVASDVVSDNSVTVFNLASDELKGRIIGREGRNIRALEAATGVNIIIDDTPEAVVLSSFDPFRREIARVSLERLLSDGRIHPTRIESVVEKVIKDINEEIKEIGSKVCIDNNIHNLNPELVRLIGKLKYRTSYGQNILQHSIESSQLAAAIAQELGVDPTIPRRAALLHDIGKAVDYDIEGTHAAIGGDLAKKYGESPVICNAIAAHHGDIDATSLVDIITQVVDAVSASRPGSRRENLETYLKRLKKLEEISTSFEGVEKAYAIQAGREVRIIVQPEILDDTNCYVLARDIKKRVENELQYPGQIQVTVIREKRVIDYAK